MAETKLLQRCWRCNGTGKLTIASLTPPFTPTVEDPCVACGGSGLVASELKLDPEVETKIDNLTTSQSAQDNEIADIKDKVNDIKEKVDEIKVVVDEILTKL